MRILLLAIILFITIHFIRIDFAEGTIPMASFANQPDTCIENETISIPVTSVEGDTIESLFALYPDTSTGFIERLNNFYVLNPHLKLQDLIGGETILVPISRKLTTTCTDSKV
ncbi:hypothetical protein ACXYMX_06150 [Sporosarcina sp. CAU 1771]